MGLFELFLLAVGLSMDAFAVAVCKGLSMPKMRWDHAFIIGLYFGGFQAIMPFFGYLLGSRFQENIVAIDHWITFILLGIIGLNMIKESRSDGDDEEIENSIGFRTMSVLAIATSIDALAVGVTFAFLQVNILYAVTFIGITTFLFSFAGTKIGNLFGAKWQSKAQLSGGVILILIGTKILLEHLGILI